MVKNTSPDTTKHFTVAYNFSTVRPGRGGSITGGNGKGETDIFINNPPADLTPLYQEIMSFIIEQIQQIPKVKKMGTIISMNITAIHELQPA